MDFAAYAYVGESVEQSTGYYKNNVAGSSTVLEAMRHHGVMVFFSSCATYGLSQTIPIPEDHPPEPNQSLWRVKAYRLGFRSRQFVHAM